MTQRDASCLNLSSISAFRNLYVTKNRFCRKLSLRNKRICAGSELPDHFGWHAGNKDIGWNILRDNATGADHTIRPDGHTS
jgi:hypothetical protein